MTAPAQDWAEKAAEAVRKGMACPDLIGTIALALSDAARTGREEQSEQLRELVEAARAVVRQSRMNEWPNTVHLSAALAPFLPEQKEEKHK